MRLKIRILDKYIFREVFLSFLEENYAVDW